MLPYFALPLLNCLGFLEVQMVFLDNSAIVIQQGHLLQRWSLDRVQVESRLLPDIHNGKTADIQTPFGLFGTTRPVTPRAKGFFPTLGYVTWIEGDDAFLDLLTGNEREIEVLKVKLVLEVYPVILFAIFGEPGQL